MDTERYIRYKVESRASRTPMPTLQESTSFFILHPAGKALCSDWSVNGRH